MTITYRMIRENDSRNKIKYLEYDEFEARRVWDTEAGLDRTKICVDRISLGIK